MEKLKDSFTKHGTAYNFIKRSEATNPNGAPVAMYSLSYDEGQIVGYDVFEIKIQKPVVFQTPKGPISYPEKESFPSSEMYGHYAFSYNTIERANEMFDNAGGPNYIPSN